MKALIFLLVGCLGASASTWAQLGIRGGGNTTPTQNGEYTLRDLIDSGNCKWQSSENFARPNTKLPLILKKIETEAFETMKSANRNTKEGNQLWNDSHLILLTLVGIRHQISLTSWCITQAPLYRVDVEDEDSVITPSQNTHLQIAVRVKLKVFVNKGLLEKLNEEDRALLIIHEMLHGIVGDAPMRNTRLRSTVRFIKELYKGERQINIHGEEVRLNDVPLYTQTREFDSFLAYPENYNNPKYQFRISELRWPYEDAAKTCLHENSCIDYLLRKGFSKLEIAGKLKEFVFELSGYDSLEQVFRYSHYREKFLERMKYLNLPIEIFCSTFYECSGVVTQNYNSDREEALRVVDVVYGVRAYFTYSGDLYSHYILGGPSASTWNWSSIDRLLKSGITLSEIISSFSPAQKQDSRFVRMLAKYSIQELLASGMNLKEVHEDADRSIVDLLKSSLFSFKDIWNTFGTEKIKQTGFQPNQLVRFFGADNCDLLKFNFPAAQLLDTHFDKCGHSVSYLRQYGFSLSDLHYRYSLNELATAFNCKELRDLGVYGRSEIRNSGCVK